MTANELYSLDNTTYKYEFTLINREGFTGILELVPDGSKPEGVRCYFIEPADKDKLYKAHQKLDLETLKEVRRAVNLKDIMSWKCIA